MSNIKYFAVNGNDSVLVDALLKHEQSTYEIDSELFERRNESYTRRGLASSYFLGNLTTDPQPMIDPLTKKGQQKPNTSDVDYINDKDYVYMANFCYETDVYWDNKDNKRYANNNYINLIFSTKGAKFNITHYKKGDAIFVSGHLRSALHVNPEDNTKKVNVQFLIVDDFVPTAGTHIRHEVEQKFSDGVASQNKTYNSIKDVLADDSLSREEQDKLIAQLARREYPNRQQAKNENSVQVNQNNRVERDAQDNASLEASIPPEKTDNNSEFSPSSSTLNPADDLRAAFDEEF